MKRQTNLDIEWQKLICNTYKIGRICTIQSLYSNQKPNTLCTTRFNPSTLDWHSNNRTITFSNHISRGQKHSVKNFLACNDNRRSYTTDQQVQEGRSCFLMSSYQTQLQIYKLGNYFFDSATALCNECDRNVHNPASPSHPQPHIPPVFRKVLLEPKKVFKK